MSSERVTCAYVAATCNRVGRTPSAGAARRVESRTGTDKSAPTTKLLRRAEGHTSCHLLGPYERDAGSARSRISALIQRERAARAHPSGGGRSAGCGYACHLAR